MLDFSITRPYPYPGSTGHPNPGENPEIQTAGNYACSISHYHPYKHATIGPVLGRCCQHRSSTVPVHAHTGMSTGIITVRNALVPRLATQYKKSRDILQIFNIENHIKMVLLRFQKISAEDEWVKWNDEKQQIFPMAYHTGHSYTHNGTILTSFW